MKKIISYFKEFFKDSFSWRNFVLLALYTIFWIVWEYKYDLTDKYLEPYDNTTQGLLRYFLFYSIVYIPVLWLCLGKYSRVQKIKLMQKGALLIVAMLFVFSYRSSSFHLKNIARDWLYDSKDFYFYYRTIAQCIQAGLIFIPIFIVWSWHNKQMNLSLQGFKRSNIRPYFYLLMGMLPLLAWASFQQDFLQTYPIYIRYLRLEGVSELPYFKVLVFELAYGIDFVATEYFFRGFLIIALGSIFGRAIILPMAVFYVTIHFGKPLGETISSFFGGFILGVIAYETKSIYGGIMIHLGIAWLMELGGSFGKVMVGN
jgi:hypothetical protein